MPIAAKSLNNQIEMYWQHRAGSEPNILNGINEMEVQDILTCRKAVECVPVRGGCSSACKAYLH